jgi:hypothetical protein
LWIPATPGKHGGLKGFVKYLYQLGCEFPALNDYAEFSIEVARARIEIHLAPTFAPSRAALTLRAFDDKPVIAHTRQFFGAAVTLSGGGLG